MSENQILGGETDSEGIGRAKELPPAKRGVVFLNGGKEGRNEVKCTQRAERRLPKGGPFFNRRRGSHSHRGRVS